MRKFPFGEYLSVFAMLLMCVGVAIPSCSKEESPPVTKDQTCDESAYRSIDDLDSALNAYRLAETEVCRRQGRQYLLEGQSDDFELWEEAYLVSVERHDGQDAIFLERMHTSARTPGEWMLFTYFSPTWRKTILKQVAESDHSTERLQEELKYIKSYALNYTHRRPIPAHFNDVSWEIHCRVYSNAIFAAMKRQAKTAVDWAMVYAFAVDPVEMRAAVVESIRLAKIDRYEGYAAVAEYLTECGEDNTGGLWSLAVAGMKKHAQTFGQWRTYLEMADVRGERLSSRTHLLVLKRMAKLAVSLNDWLEVYRLAPADSEMKETAEQAIGHQVRNYEDFRTLIDTAYDIAQTDEEMDTFYALYLSVADTLIDQLTAQPPAEAE